MPLTNGWSQTQVNELLLQNYPISDPEVLLQEMDINRLRAVVYRDVVIVLVMCNIGVPVKILSDRQFLQQLRCLNQEIFHFHDS